VTTPVSPPMSKEHELHLASVLESFVRDASRKYRAGQAEHGGNLWQRPVWSDLMAEVCDMVFYAYTHKLQLATIADLALAGARDDSVAAATAREACLKILQILQGIPGSQDKK